MSANIPFPYISLDFYALESMLAGNAAQSAEVGSSPADAPGLSTSSARSSRFSKYLKFARRRNRTSQVGSITSVVDEETNASARELLMTYIACEA